MTVTLTYDDDNARVIIDADGFSTLVDNVMIERSTDQVAWTTVRGATELPLTAGAISGTGHADYEFASCVENFYRVSAEPKGLYLPGTSGNYASTPDVAALDITGNIDLRADITPDDWTPTANQVLVGKYTTSGNQRAYRLRLDTTGALSIIWSTNGTNEAILTSTEAIDAAAGERLAVRATLNVNDGLGNKVATFYTSTSIDGPWTEFDQVVSVGTTSIFASTAILEVGSQDVGTAGLFAGVIHAVQVWNGIGVTVVANPDFTAQTHQDTSFTDGAGRTWTINGTASIETTQGPESITPQLTKVWFKSVTRPFLNQSVDLTCEMGGSPLELLATEGAVRRSTRANVFPIINRTFPVAVTDLSLGRSWQLRLRTWTTAAFQLLDFLFASGDVIFIQVPCNCGQTIENGYVVAYDPSYVRHRRYRNRVVWESAVEEVAPPGPDVAYREATWATVIAQFGTWQAVLNACPTWAHVLALLPDPSEVIVE